MKNWDVTLGVSFLHGLVMKLNEVRGKSKHFNKNVIRNRKRRVEVG